MTTYNVHLYREMRLAFGDIEADSPEAAAAIARGKPTNAADHIADCEGVNLAALVDVQDDEDYEHSVRIDFESERRPEPIAPRLLAALEAILPYAEGEAYSLEKLKDSAEAETEAARAEQAVEAALAAVAEAEAAGIEANPAALDVHALLAARRQIAAIWSIEDVKTLRPDFSDEQAWEVLRRTEKYHDCNYGITWETLNCHADVLDEDTDATVSRPGAGHE